MLYSDFFAVSQVAGIAKPGNDISMFVEQRVDGCTPERHIVGILERVTDIIDAFLRGNHTAEVNLGRTAFGAESLIAQFHASAGSKHRVGDDECLTRQVGRSHVFNADAHILTFLVAIITIGRDKGVASLIENIEKTLVERQSGSENGSYDNRIVRRVAIGHSQRCCNLLDTVFQPLAHLVGHCMANAREIVAEAHTVALHVNIAQFGNVLVDHTLMVGKIVNFHIF